ncbi:MAG: DUF86 domain-containing protein [Deltaproteobacteria bacterium]|jgi:uncharacterized protein YutE (UPF0331/DUF86 family)|nr:DUF86 domain-containing protein [Deltaproteobacteria bacterium]
MINFKSNYLPSIREHINQCSQELEELHTIIIKGDWSQPEYRAAERLLQILIESLIGVGKQWLKSMDQLPINDAYQTMEKLCVLNKIPPKILGDIKKMIGLRNAIVHDYLNINREIIKDVVKNKHYLLINKIINLI